MARPRTTALRPMHEWPSYAYWRASDERVKQFWYVSFCLMMSSVQDRLTGLALREAGNLNWATTAFYYSAVHAGRVVSFVCCGDYPKGHSELAAMLSGVGTGVKVNWLKAFREYVHGHRGGELISAMEGTAEDSHGRLVDAVSTSFPTQRALVDRFSGIPGQFRNLRNDCNYEALLVAHELDHLRVTPGFEKLASASERASSLAVQTAIAMYLDNLRSAECFRGEHTRFNDAHRTYVRGRLEECLAKKFEGSSAALNGLRQSLEMLRPPGEHPPIPPVYEVERFLAPIMYDDFGEKQGLMMRWDRDIAALEKAVEE